MAERSAALHDPSLPGLDLLRRPSQFVGVVWSRLADWFGADVQLLDSRVDILRYVPRKRCVVELELVTGKGGGGISQRRRFIAKLYAGEKGAQVHDTLRELWGRGFAAGRLAVCQPLAYDRDWKLLVLGWANGEPLRSLVLTQKDAAKVMEDAAAWLLKLHTCGVNGGRAYTFSRHLHTLGLHQRYLAEACPEAEPVFGEVLRGVERRGATLSGWSPAPTHRDFSPDHLFWKSDRLTALDFDEFCQYDPLFDVAHFVAHLRFLSLGCFGALDRFDRLAERFEASYRAGTPGYHAERVRLYQAIAYLKLAYIAGAVRRGPDRIVATLLQEARRFV